jgi:hypothetical protein
MVTTIATSVAKGIKRSGVVSAPAEPPHEIPVQDLGSEGANHGRKNDPIRTAAAPISRGARRLRSPRSNVDPAFKLSPPALSTVDPLPPELPAASECLPISERGRYH